LLGSSKPIRPHLLLQTMNYELAKQLKEAGFSQGGKGSWTLPSDSLVARAGDRIYVPTLSELIAACGKIEFTLMREIVDDVSGWLAVVYEPIIQCGGLTAEEAVARLWLALSKKA
jgi:hypothetical protein